MATPSSLLRDHHDAVARARDRAPHEEQILLGVDPDHFEPELGVAPVAHVARHPLALYDPGGIGAGADRAGLAVPGVAVGGGTAARAVAVHDALEAPPLGPPGHLDQLAGGEDLHRDFGPRGERLAHQLEAPHDVGGRLEPGLLGVALLGPLPAAL